MTRIYPPPTDRLPKFKRVRTGRPSFVLQPRDIDLVRLVADYRIVSADIVQALVPGSAQVLSRRLQRLFHAGILDRPRQQRVRTGNPPMVYALGPKGAPLVGGTLADSRRDWSEKNRTAGLSFIEHALMLSRFRAALALAAAQRGDVEVERFVHGMEIWDEVRIQHEDWTERIPVAPDAFATLRLLNEPEGRNRIHAYVEVDRATMTLRRFTSKLRGYWHYWRSGRLEERFGIRNALVVTVTMTTERAANLREAAKGVDSQGRGSRMFLFGPEEAFTVANPAAVLSAMWTTPADDTLHSILE